MEMLQRETKKNQDTLPPGESSRRLGEGELLLRLGVGNRLSSQPGWLPPRSLRDRPSQREGDKGMEMLQSGNKKNNDTLPPGESSRRLGEGELLLRLGVGNRLSSQPGWLPPRSLRDRPSQRAGQSHVERR